MSATVISPEPTRLWQKQKAYSRVIIDMTLYFDDCQEFVFMNAIGFKELSWQV